MAPFLGTSNFPQPDSGAFVGVKGISQQLSVPASFREARFGPTSGWLAILA
jgi:hypothetical protein